MKFKEPPYLHHNRPKYAHHTNKAVNLSLVTSIHIGRERYYPDNEGIPILIFTFESDNYTA